MNDIPPMRPVSPEEYNRSRMTPSDQTVVTILVCVVVTIVGGVGLLFFALHESFGP
jgi:hypothetical protein